MLGDISQVEVKRSEEERDNNDLSNPMMKKERIQMVGELEDPFGDLE